MQDTTGSVRDAARYKRFKGGAYVSRQSGLTDPLDPICHLYSALGNTWRLKTFLYLYEHPDKCASPTDIFMSIGAPSYYVTQWGLKILECNGLVEFKEKKEGYKYFGLTERGVWVADVLSQINELISIQEGHDHVA